MLSYDLNNYIKGWFVGNFSKSIIQTEDFEVAVKRYNAGNYENRHYHKIATELTIIIEGEVEMNGIKYIKDDIIKIEPNESTDFKCLKDTITVVIKTPSVKNDKWEK